MENLRYKRRIRGPFGPRIRYYESLCPSEGTFRMLNLPLAKRLLTQMRMMVPPTEPQHLVNKQYYEQNLVSPKTLVLTEPGLLTVNREHILKVEGDYTLPAVFEEGQTVSIHCDCSTARILMNGNVIARIGSGNNLVMSRNHAITLKASEANNLIFTYLAEVGKVNGGGGTGNSDSKFTVINAVTNQLQSNGRYLITEAGDYSLPEAMELGETILIHAKVANVRILSGSFVITGVGAGNNLVLNEGNTVTLLASSGTELEIL